MTVCERVRTILSKEWLPAFKVRTELANCYKPKKWLSESAVTARIRELRKHGSKVECRKNGRHYEYRVMEG